MPATGCAPPWRASGCKLRTPPSPCSIAVVAEEEGHHPDLHLTGYNTVVAEMTTHAANGLTENDFIMAAKVGWRAAPGRLGGRHVPACRMHAAGYKLTNMEPHHVRLSSFPHQQRHHALVCHLQPHLPCRSTSWRSPTCCPSASPSSGHDLRPSPAQRRRGHPCGACATHALQASTKCPTLGGQPCRCTALHSRLPFTSQASNAALTVATTPPSSHDPI